MYSMNKYDIIYFTSLSYPSESSNKYNPDCFIVYHLSNRMDLRVQNQIRDVEIIYRALTQYYREGNVLVFSSFNSLPRRGGVPDYARIIFKQESSDSREQGGDRYPLRLVVSMPDMSRLMAQKTIYPDNQVTFLISPSSKGTYCTMLFYVQTADGDR